MALTTEQKTAVKADIEGDVVLNAFPNNSDGAFAIAAIYNTLASPDTWGWRTYVSKNEITSSAGPEGTTFSFPQLIARTAGEQFGWRELFNGTESCNPSLPNVRQGFADVFSGAQAGPTAQRTHLLAVARRKLTRLEKLLASGTGSTGSPATMTFEGQVGYQDIQDARNS
jgi:hypothetical protein